MNLFSQITPAVQAALAFSFPAALIALVVWLDRRDAKNRAGKTNPLQPEA